LHRAETVYLGIMCQIIISQKNRFTIGIRMSQNTGHILIVDDTHENLMILHDTLHGSGYRVAVAEDGVSALRSISKNIPSLILLDVMMPGIDGFETCRRIRENPEWANIPIIFITALSDTEHKVEAFKVGGVDFISKPLQTQEVLARVHTHLKLARTQDILKEKNAELLQLNQEKNEFLGMAAHDLKNPLASIRGMAQLIKAKVDIETKENQQINSYAACIENNAQKMFTLITNLLDVNAIESGTLTVNFENVQCVDILKTVIKNYQLAATDKNIELKLIIPQDVPLLLSNNDVLQQVLDNLVSNAVKYSPLNSDIEIKLLVETDHIQINIQDHGSGFTEEDKTKLFSKFARLSAKPTGGEHSTGLGLFIVKKLVDSLNAEVWCESEVNNGACFIVSLPLMKEKTGEINPNWRILVAEDNVFNQKIALLNLKKLGITADVATNGKEVLTAMMQQTYDIILMDIQMPEMDGLQATNEIYRQYGTQRPRIIAVTGNAIENQACIDAGMDGYLVKPFNEENLQRVLINVATSV